MGCFSFPGMSLDRAAYPSDVSDEEWALVAPYLALLRESSGQRDHDLREVFNGLRYIVKTGAPWRFMPHDLPPWAAVYQQTQRWLAAECFADVAGDLRAVLRMAAVARAGAVCGDPGQPHAALLARERRAGGLRRGQAQARLEGASGGGHARPRGGAARHTSRCRRPRRGGPAGGRAFRRRRAAAWRWASSIRATPAPGRPSAAQAHGIDLEVVKAPEAKRGFVLLPRRWVVERSFAWATRCRRLGQRLRALCQHARRIAHGRLRLPHAQTGRTTDDKFITRSRRRAAQENVVSEVFDLSDAAQREEAAQAEVADLQAALVARTEEERRAFWKAINIYYVPALEDEDG